MKRFLSTSFLALGLAASPALAFDIDSMSKDERAAFRAEIRAYLLDNPEVIMEAVELLEKRNAAAEAAHDLALVQVNADAIFNDGFSWVGGNPEGDVTLVEFIDYRCGYCRKAFDEVEQLIETDGNIRMIVKEFPILGEASVLSSRYAIAVKNTLGDDEYKLAHNALITFKGDINAGSLTRISESLGFEAAPLLAAMDSAEVTEEIRQTRALAQKLQISGTPTFVLQDQLLRGYLPLDNMLALVDEKRAK
ncbi:DsbA family protein [Shimia aestuarii]|uniref:Protein-disulfide isomerase n=1 Tax=Shimia aestuarii TaxID=254406 RepID=A0A1I4QP77_9RHOB|nr:DsbA family protein [Shimia aestuarii]SFM41841.1 Protein-disulfide isomerase [Shimia aestuarii]